MDKKTILADVVYVGLNNREALAFRSLVEHLSDETQVFHYMKTEHFVRMLQEEAMFLSRCSEFSDCNDGRLPEINQIKNSQMADQLDFGKKCLTPQQRYEQNERARQETFVHCWFSGDWESESMWEEYGDRHQGICIHSTTGLLNKTLIDAGFKSCFRIGRVVYLDDSTPLPSSHLDIPIFRKDPKFRHEQEIRIAVLRRNQAGMKMEGSKLKISIKPETLIKDVRIGKNVPLKEDNQIRELVEKLRRAN